MGFVAFCSDIWMEGGGNTHTEMERVLANLPLEGVPLIFVDFWVQIHNLPFGLISEVMGRQFGNFIGTFLKYDMKAMGRGFRGYMRYERLTVFCFLCGRLGYFDGFCLVHDA
ncbi:hypothetical protein Golax_018513, partial [Gossypium laxum]|nr:hypothetical protein [Gossypium laxum]